MKTIYRNPDGFADGTMQIEHSKGKVRFRMKDGKLDRRGDYGWTKRVLDSFVKRKMFTKEVVK